MLSLAVNPSISVSVDRDLFAYNIRFMRSVKNLTREEVAKISGVGLMSLYRVEKGLPVRLQTMKRICKGLGVDFTEMNTMKRMLNLKREDQPYVVHYNHQYVWYEAFDKRSRLPIDNQDSIQTAQERQRLGRTGLVAAFRTGLSFIMPQGPGVLLTEVYGTYEKMSSTLYDDWITMCLRGEVTLNIQGDTIYLKEGEAIGYGKDLQLTFGPTHPIGPNELPPLLLFMAANPIGKLPKTRKPPRKPV